MSNDGSNYGVDFTAFDERTNSVARLKRLFQYDHLPEHLQQVSCVYAALAVKMLDTVPDSPELVLALRSLWDAKNYIVLCAARPE